jgi:hypothetical protein
VSPFGAIVDVMVEAPDGRRRRYALTDFVAASYVFDEVRLVPVIVRRGSPADGRCRLGRCGCRRSRAAVAC